MVCAQYGEYIGDRNRAHLDELINEALIDIRQVFGIDPIFGISNEELAQKRIEFVSRAITPPAITIFNPNRQPDRIPFEGNQRAWSIDNTSWNLPVNRPYFISNTFRGFYNYDSGSIFLHHPIWCRHTIIHEVLHSVSIFTRFFKTYISIAQWNLHIPFIEGINECLTGIILQRRYPNCYDYWINKRLTQCEIDTPSRVKLWCSLCQCTDMRDLATFYLSRNNNLQRTWDTYQEQVRTRYPNFRYPFNVNIPFRENIFKDVCVREIREFRDIFESKSNLDFSKIH